MKPKFSSTRRFLSQTFQCIGLRTVTLCMLTAGHAFAQDTWDGGGGDNKWSTGLNWVDNTAPSASAGVLTFSGNTQLITSNDLIGITATNINFTNDGSSGQTGAFTLGGNTITLGGTISTTSGGSMTDIIDLNLIMNGNRTFSTSGTHNLTINGLISQTGTNRTLNKAAGGLLTLTNSGNSFTGQVTVSNGTVAVTGIADAGVASAMGAGSSFRVGSGTNSTTVTFISGAASTNRQVQIGDSNTGGGRINNNTANGSGALIFTNTDFNLSQSASNARTLTLGGTNTDANAINGKISDHTGAGGTIALTKVDAGHWTLGGLNSYTGATNVNGGTLVVNGNISTSALTTVASGASLVGTGTVGKAVINGILSVGTSAGQMTFAETLSLNGSTLMEIDGTAGAGVTGGHDFVNLTGAGAAGVLTYGGTMTLDIGVIFGAGTYSWNLFDAASETGTFSSIILADKYFGSLVNTSGVWDLASGSDTWKFTEASGILQLTVIPEPNAIALFGGITAIALIRRRNA